VLAQQELRQQRDRAADETAALKAMIDELSRARSEIEARAVDLSEDRNWRLTLHGAQIHQACSGLPPDFGKTGWVEEALLCESGSAR
jgi:hypothetical protein